ncbi:MAG: MFS transporter [Methanocellales archaeon]
MSSAYVAILLLGIVSLMGDVVYEGSRGLVPDYFNFLGATAFIIGLSGGIGDFLGYALRLVSGFLADTTRAYWFFIFLGYGLIIAIPLLGFIYSLELAIILVILERIGKALRSPSRDTVLSILSRDLGAGKAFGIHEFLDQIGAVAGPLIVAFVMFHSSNNYQQTFSLLMLPFLVLIIVLFYTYSKIGSKIAEPTSISSSRVLQKPFYIYTFAVMLNTVGLIPAALILYRASVILQPEHKQWMVPLIYLLIQGIDAIAALIAGYAFDKFGIKILALSFALSIFPPIFTLSSQGFEALIIASIFFGSILGMQESIYRAAVSKLAPLASRGTAYGVFNAAYGISILMSGAIYGLMMDYKATLASLLLFIFTMQTAAIASLMLVDEKRAME